MKFFLKNIFFNFAKSAVLIACLFAATPSYAKSQLDMETMKAAYDGDAKLQLAVADYYLKSGDKDDIPQGLEWLHKSAVQNYAPAQLYLGVLYGDGKVLPRNMEEAIRWRELAAKNGSPKDKFALGNAYLFGFMLPKNLKRAAYWIEESAEGGYIEAIEKCIEFYEKLDDAESANYWNNKLAIAELKEAENGNAKAMYASAGRYFMGSDGFDKSISSGVRWLRMSSDAGYEKAMERLASFYLEGKYVSQNRARALEIYEKMAESRPVFYTQISAFYNEGKYGFPIDKNLARKYLEKYASSNAEGSDTSRLFLIWTYWKEGDTESALVWCAECVNNKASILDHEQIKKTADKIADKKMPPKNFEDFIVEFMGVEAK